MHISAVIFDRDGVLTFFDRRSAISRLAPLLPASIEDLVDLWEIRCRAHGFPVSMADEIAAIQQFWQELSLTYSLPVDHLTQLEGIDYTEFLQPFPDARAALRQCRRRDLHVGVVSNFSLASLEYSLKSVALAQWIDVFYPATVLGSAKPDPAAYLAVTEALLVKPEESLYIDDEEECVQGAERVGMQAYWLRRDMSHHDFARRIICDLSALEILLQDSAAATY